MKATSTTLIAVSIAALGQLSLANDKLPGQTIFEYRFSADEIDFDQKSFHVAPSASYADRQYVGSKAFDKVTAEMALHILSGDGSETFLMGRTHRVEDGTFVQSTVELNEITGIQFVESTDTSNAFMMTAEDEYTREKYFQLQNYRWDIDAYESLKTTYVSNSVNTDDAGRVSGSDIWHGPMLFGDRYLYNVVDAGGNLLMVEDKYGETVSSDLITNVFSGVRSMHVISDHATSYVYFKSQEVDTARNGITGTYWISDLKTGLHQSLPLHKAESDIHSEISGGNTNSLNRNVIHVEGEESFKLAPSGSVYTATNYDVIFDIVQADGSWLQDKREVLPLHFEGMMTSPITIKHSDVGPIDEYQFIFIQHDALTGKQYLTFVQSNATYHLGTFLNNDPYTVERRYEVEPGLQISGTSDPSFMFNEQTGELVVTALWLIPDGHGGQREEVAASVLLNESDVADMIDSRDLVEEDVTVPDTDTDTDTDTESESEVTEDEEIEDVEADVQKAAEAAGGSVSGLLVGFLALGLALTRRKV